MDTAEFKQQFLPYHRKLYRVAFRLTGNPQDEEIEQATGLNAINIRVLLSRARKKIREQYNAIMNYESK